MPFAVLVEPMFESISSALRFKELNVLAILDVVVLSFLIYRLLLLIRARRASKVLAGVFLVVLVHFLSGPMILNLRGLHTAIGYLLLYIPFAIIVLFQNPIRQALVRIAQNPLAALMPRQRIERKVAEEVALAAASLASKRIGALIVIERELGLRSFYDTGILLDAQVTYDLLMNIFAPGAPLHDGAAIIAESRIKAASCYLPLTTNPGLSRTYGTRHRAAIGITEEYDALAVVVSEERGVVSLAEDGKIIEDLDAQGLMARLSSALIPGSENGEEAGAPATKVVDSSHA
jgi:uncharacterized protein (TIGR00159 family)